MICMETSFQVETKLNYGCLDFGSFLIFIPMLTWFSGFQGNLLT